jgi:SAM-dependent methyltransferase
MQVYVPEEERFLWKILACPHCQQPLRETSTGAECVSCHIRFPRTRYGQLDLRLQRNKKVLVPFTLTPSHTPNQEMFHILSFNPNPEGNFGTLFGITPELASYIPKAHPSNSLMLDLGCGDTRHRSNFVRAGFKYVGLDYDSKQATLLGDAHALPFQNECFKFIFSRAVIEHLRYPFIAMHEAYRVLKPNSKLVGSAAFLEPFHGNSFYHPTHLGFQNLLEHAGFTVQHIAPHPRWDVLTAQASMSLFPKMPAALSRMLIAPLKELHKAWWRIGGHFNPEADELTRLLWTAGSFQFVAEKP